MTRNFGDIPANEPGWPSGPPAGGEAFPIGSIWLGYVSTDPATLLGYGTWVSIGAGRVLVGLDSGDPDFDTVGETGGAKTVAAAGSVAAPVFTGTPRAAHTHGLGASVTGLSHTGSAVADHTDHTHSVTSNVSVADHAAHTHSVVAAGTISWPAGVPTITWPANVPTHSGTTATTSGDGASSTGVTGGGGTSRNTIGHTHTVNITSQGTVAWPANPPTAAWPAGVPVFAGSSVTSGNPSAVLSHSVTNNPVTSGGASLTLMHNVTQPTAHTIGGSTDADGGFTPAGTNSAPAFTGSQTSVVQPYFVVYMWRRSA